VAAQPSQPAGRVPGRRLPGPERPPCRRAVCRRQRANPHRLGRLWWPGHGRWYPTEDWYPAFCAANDYEVKLIRTIDQGIPARDMVACVAIRRGGEFFTMPEVPMYESPGGKVGEYVS
jgi:hypothetical protein